MTGPVVPLASDAGSNLSIVIVTYNSATVLASTLASIARLLPEAEVIIVDNGSTDATLSVAVRLQVSNVITGHGNVGFGTGVNLGVAAASRPVVLVLNPDAALDAVDADELRTLLEAHPMGLVSCTIVDGKAPPIMQHWGWKREVGFWLWRALLCPREMSPSRPAARPGGNAWIGGTAFIASKDEWESVGGFDERIFLYFEDVDLSRRYRGAGFPLRVTGSVRARHLGGDSRRGAEQELVQSWILRSLVEMTATSEGIRAAEHAATAIVAGLAMVECAARLGSLVPWVGTRAARKAVAARRLRRLVLKNPAQGTNERHYPRANVAFACVRRSPVRAALGASLA